MQSLFDFPDRNQSRLLHSASRSEMGCLPEFGLDRYKGSPPPDCSAARQGSDSFDCLSSASTLSYSCTSARNLTGLMNKSQTHNTIGMNAAATNNIPSPALSYSSSSPGRVLNEDTIPTHNRAQPSKSEVAIDNHTTLPAPRTSAPPIVYADITGPPHRTASAEAPETVSTCELSRLQPLGNIRHSRSATVAWGGRFPTPPRL